MLNRIFRKSNEYQHKQKSVQAWVNKDGAKIRYIPDLGTGELAKGTAVMAGMKAPNGFRLCQLVNHQKGIVVAGWIFEADLQYTAPTA